MQNSGVFPTHITVASSRTVTNKSKRHLASPMMGHKTAAMDDRYTIIDDEALDVAVAKMNEYQKSQSMMSPTTELESQLEMWPEKIGTNCRQPLVSRSSHSAGATPNFPSFPLP